jgi:hypothetical protein
MAADENDTSTVRLGFIEMGLTLNLEAFENSLCVPAVDIDHFSDVEGKLPKAATGEPITRWVIDCRIEDCGIVSAGDRRPAAPCGVGEITPGTGDGVR